MTNYWQLHQNVKRKQYQTLVPVVMIFALFSSCFSQLSDMALRHRAYVFYEYYCRYWRFMVRALHLKSGYVKPVTELLFICVQVIFTLVGLGFN